MPIEPEEKKDVPPTETRCQGQGPPPGGGSEDASVSEERPQESSKSPPDSSSTSSSSPDSDMDFSGRSRNKELHLRLSPESVLSAKRCLWDVDRKEVDESLSRELKRIHQEESVAKSRKYNFNFDKEVPEEGDFHWEKAEEPPDFYKPKIYPSKRSSQNRASPYEKPPKRRLLEAVSSTAGSTSSSDMIASSSTSSVPSLSPYLVSTSSELSALASKISSISSTTKDCEKPSPVQMASESTDIFEGKEKSSKDSLTLVVASSSSVGSSSSSSGDDRSSTTLPNSKRSRISQEQPILITSAREDTPILSTCTSPFSVCSVVNVSSSDSSSKASASKDSSGSSSSSSTSNNNNRSNNGQNVSDIMDVCSSSSSNTCQTSSRGRGSGTTSGILPSHFYSVESDQGSEGGTTSSTSTDPPPQTKEKGKVPPGKPPKPPTPTSGESSSSHLLKYYR